MGKSSIDDDGYFQQQTVSLREGKSDTIHKSTIEHIWTAQIALDDPGETRLAVPNAQYASHLKAGEWLKLLEDLATRRSKWWFSHEKNERLTMKHRDFLA